MPTIKQDTPDKPEVDNRYKLIHTRTIRQIAKEIQEKPKEEIKPEEKPPEKPAPEMEKEKAEREQRETERAAQIAKTAADEAATKVAEETKKAFSEKVDEILAKDKSMADKQKELDELIPVWQKENRIPKDYPEIIKEQLRINEAHFNQLEKQREEKEATDRKAADEKAAADKVELDKKQGAERLAEFQRQIAQDLDELYTDKELPRPEKFEEVNNPDTKDENAKLTQKVLQFGVELNTRLAKEGKPPVTSLYKIYHSHYKPFIAANPASASEQPPGANAPIAGSRNTPTGGETKVTPYAQLHKETWAQTAYRVGKNITKAITGA